MLCFKSTVPFFLLSKTRILRKKIKHIVREFYGQLPPAPKARITFPPHFKGPLWVMLQFIEGRRKTSWISCLANLEHVITGTPFLGRTVVKRANLGACCICELNPSVLLRGQQEALDAVLSCPLMLGEELGLREAPQFPSCRGVPWWSHWIREGCSYLPKEVKSSF